MRLHWMKSYVSAVFVQLASGSNVSVKYFRDGVARCQSCLVSDCEHTRAVHDYLDSAYTEDAARSHARAA